MTQLLQFTRELAPEVSIFNVRTLFGLIEFVLLVWGVGALYRYVPYAQVRWTHALIGGLWVALATELARKLLVLYFGKMPAYSAIYGAFATVPILLICIYAAWVIVLIGAVMVANLPKLLGLSQRENRSVGWRFQFAVEVLQQLALAKQTATHGLSLREICEALQLDPLQLEEVMTVLTQLDWVARLSEEDGRDEPRYVLLADPHHTPLMPLMQRLLIESSEATRGLWMKWGDLRLRDAL